MRRILIIAAVFLVIPSTVLAQRGRRGGGRGLANMTQNVAALLVQNREDLGLGDELVAQLEALGTEFDESTDSLRQEIQAAMAARRGGGGGQPEEMMAKIQELQQKNDEFFENQVKPLLSEEQATKATELITASRAMRGRRGGRRGGR